MSEENICAKCGYEEFRHPVGFVSLGKFRWVCKKFIPKETSQRNEVTEVSNENK